MVFLNHNYHLLQLYSPMTFFSKCFKSFLCVGFFKAFYCILFYFDSSVRFAIWYRSSVHLNEGLILLATKWIIVRSADFFVKKRLQRLHLMKAYWILLKHYCSKDSYMLTGDYRYNMYIICVSKQVNKTNIQFQFLEAFKNFTNYKHSNRFNVFNKKIF